VNGKQQLNSEYSEGMSHLPWLTHVGQSHHHPHSQTLPVIHSIEESQSNAWKDGRKEGWDVLLAKRFA
jgi:hypothetical protein